MITKELINSNLTATNSVESNLNLKSMKAMVNWDIDGGDGASTRNIYLYGRLNHDNNPVAVGETGSFDATEWVLIDSVENQARTSRGYFTLNFIYPQVVVRTSGNSGTSVIRVWATYN